MRPLQQGAALFPAAALRSDPGIATLFTKTFFSTTAHYKEPTPGDKSRDCHCKALIITIVQTNRSKDQKLGTKTVIIKRVCCTVI